MLLYVIILCEGGAYQGELDMMDHSEAALSQEGGSTFQVEARQHSPELDQT